LSANQSKLLHSWALCVSCGQILGLYNFEISGFVMIRWLWAHGSE